MVSQTVPDDPRFGGRIQRADFDEPESVDHAAVADLAVEDPSLSVDAGTLLLSLSVLGATLSLVLSLTGSSELSLAARLVVAAVATAALVAECAMGQRSVTELHPLATLCGPVVAVVAGPDPGPVRRHTSVCPAC